MELEPPRLTPTSPRIAYRVHGEAGPRVLLIMGLAMRGRVWRHQLADLSADHRCAVYDHRGLGDSDPIDAGFSMADMAGDALRVLDDLGWDEAHVVGVSMGGMVSQELALAAPRRLRSLTLIVTHGGGPLAWVPTLRGARSFLGAASSDPERRAAGLATLLYPDHFIEAQGPQVMRAALEDRLSYRAPRGTVLRQIRAVHRHHTLQRLATLSVPTLVVKAGQDALVDPGHSDTLAATIPGATLVTYHDAGHGLIYQRAADLNARLRAHFSACDRVRDD